MTMNKTAPRRSVLYVPATNTRATEKARNLPCDVIVFDLEDAVAPAMKGQARDNLASAIAAQPFAAHETVIRVNALGTAEFDADLRAAAACGADAILLPKVDTGADLERFAEAIGAIANGPAPKLWAMIETASAIHHLDGILQAGQRRQVQLDCLVVGTNDLAKETGVYPGDNRAYLLPWLMSVVLAARRYGMDVLDGVWNDFGDRAGFDNEVLQSCRMGFDGKTLIHPSQVDPANAAFTPSDAAIAEAQAIVAAFARPEHAAAGVINLDGRMVERLHLAQATRLLARLDAIRARRERTGR
ncbi:CoA ester lyase [Cupriavidus necator]|uniref:HpcH/HpaI aldolase/citrate lyase family protein n=1 Tax=Cupriavidus necator TaxID=106590 RepID=UPI0039C46BF0